MLQLGTVAVLKRHSSYCFPNEDFGRVNKRCNPSRRQLVQPSATSPLFFDNLHFEHFDKSVHLDSWLTFLSKCSKWRLSKKRGLVAYDCAIRIFRFTFNGLWPKSSTPDCIVCQFIQNLCFGCMQLPCYIPFVVRMMLVSKSKHGHLMMCLPKSKHCSMVMLCQSGCSRPEFSRALWFLRCIGVLF